MYAVSSSFKTAMKQPIKQLKAYIKLEDDSQIADNNLLINFKISCESGMCKTAMRKIEINYIGDTNLLGHTVHAGFGVKLPSSQYEYLDYGSFLITEFTHTKDRGISKAVGYDLMINTMVAYDSSNFGYPITLGAYLTSILSVCGLELGTDLEEEDVIHRDWIIEQDLFANIKSVTYRDVLVQIAQMFGRTVIIGNDDKVYFKLIEETEETLTYDNMFKLKLEPIYGEINSVVLSRTPQEDNVFLKDDASIQQYGLTEFKIENNEFCDKNRQEAIQPIYNTLRGISYYPFDTTTEGLGWFEIGDRLTIIDNDNTEYSCAIFNYSITIAGSIRETLKAKADTKTQTQYQFAISLERRLQNTEIVVDKQEGDIEIITEKLEGVDENIAQINLDLSNINLSVSQVSENLSSNYLTKDQVDSAINTNNENIELLKQAVEQKISATDLTIAVRREIDNGVSQIVTNTGYRFDDDGLNISKEGEEMSNLLDNTGMFVKRDNDEVLGADATGVRTENLKVRKYLEMGLNSRFEDYKSDRTGCFYTGGVR